MITLPSGMSLRATMASATGTNQPRWTVNYRTVPAQTKDDYQELRGQIARGLLDDTNVVTLLDGPTSGPAQGAVNDIYQITMVNRSTATEIIEFQTTDGTTIISNIRQTLTAEQSVSYEHGSGWQVVGP